MKALFLSHQTALDYWDTAIASRPEELHVLRCASSWSELPEPIGGIVEARNLGSPTAPPAAAQVPSDRMHVLVSSQKDRHAGARISQHLWSGPMPPCSLAYFSSSPQVVVSTPEFVFLQMSYELDFGDLAQLGMEMCGRFTTGADGRRIERPALTSREKILSFLKVAGPARGSLRARSVARWLANGAASPMEAVTYLLLCLPPRYGGYGLPLPELNISKPVPERLWRFTDKRELIMDVLWESQNLDVEYDSDEDHTGGRKGADDSLRRTMLEEMGYRVISVNKALEDGARGFDQIAYVVAKATKFRMRRPSEQQSLTRERLRGQLLDRDRNWKFHTRYSQTG